MRVAFISFEAPPDSLVGGIGTYIGQAARVLASRGHEVEVFAASSKPRASVAADGYITHLIESGFTFEDRLLFSSRVGPVFAERHAEAPFDVLEGPEFLAEAADARRLVPEIPLVIKLHMSMTLIRELNRPPMSGVKKIKKRIRGALQPVLQLDRWKERDYQGIELSHLLEADEISAPCGAIADITARMWGLDRAGMAEVPYPFIPSELLLSVPVETSTDTVGFVGRLEQRKGVIDLARAIPFILQLFPKTRFLFAGKSLASPVKGIEMEDYLGRMLEPVKDRVRFCGAIEPGRIDKVFREMDIAVLPSLWENFPNVCLEAMAAGRAIVGSEAGGMKDQLDGGNAGLLIPPGDPRAIADAVCRLLGNRKLRLELAAAARSRLLTAYSADRIGELMEQSYQKAIERKQAAKREWQKA